jgi:hypothetical protein
MDAAEYVVSEDDRMALASLALDSLSDAVSDESILYFIATLDTEADLQLIINTGVQLRPSRGGGGGRRVKVGCEWVGFVGQPIAAISDQSALNEIAVLDTEAAWS